MVTLCNRADHYIFILWFLLSSSSFFFSSPNLSRHRLQWLRLGEEKKERKKKKPQAKDIMVCPIPQGDHNK